MVDLLGDPGEVAHVLREQPVCLDVVDYGFDALRTGTDHRLLNYHHNLATTGQKVRRLIANKNCQIFLIRILLLPFSQVWTFPSIPSNTLFFLL